MQTREKDFLDIEKLTPIYSFQIFWKKAWIFVSDDAGGLLKFETCEARYAARAEYRKKQTGNGLTEPITGECSESVLIGVVRNKGEQHERCNFD